MEHVFAYRVAGHCFTVQAEEGTDIGTALAHYAPFAAEPDPAEKPVFRLRVVPPGALSRPAGLTEEYRQDDDGSQIRVCRTPGGGSWFEFSLRGEPCGTLLTAPGFGQATFAPGAHPDFGLNNALMVLYAMSTASLRTALFHASVIGNGDRGYLFLGKSGTGKSTHACLWLEHVPGSELVNDDNPVVRIEEDGAIRVHGSPWSGKTLCHRNTSLPLGGFVQLGQAPFNRIRRLRGIEAYAALVPGISGKRWERAIADGLHHTENTLASSVPVWRLDCLPDAEAARLCAETITRT